MFDVHLFVSFCFSFQNIDICHPVFHLGVILKCNKSFLFFGLDLKIFVWLSTLPSPHPSCWAFLFGQPPNVFQTGAEQSLYFYFLFSRTYICAPFVFCGGEQKGLYLCLCGDHWPLAFSLKAAFSFSEGNTSFATDRKFAHQQVQIQKSLSFATFVSQLRRGIKNTDILRSDGL